MRIKSVEESIKGEFVLGKGSLYEWERGKERARVREREREKERERNRERREREREGRKGCKEMNEMRDREKEEGKRCLVKVYSTWIILGLNKEVNFIFPWVI